MTNFIVVFLCVYALMSGKDIEWYHFMAVAVLYATIH